MKKIFKKQNKGFTLIETLVGLLIFSLAILSLMSILGSGISNTNYAKQKIIAGYLAQEGIEYIRNQRDTYMLFNPSGSQAGWDDFKNVIVDQSYPIGDSDFSEFNREITASPVAGTDDEMLVTSTVSWTQNSGVQSITFSEHIFKWVE